MGQGTEVGGEQASLPSLMHGRLQGRPTAGEEEEGRCADCSGGGAWVLGGHLGGHLIYPGRGRLPSGAASQQIQRVNQGWPGQRKEGRGVQSKGRTGSRAWRQARAGRFGEIAGGWME